MTSDELLKRGGLFRVKINLTDAFDGSDPAEAEAAKLLTQENGDSHYIVLREISSAEMLEIQGKEQGEMTDCLEKKIPDCIVEHSFKKADGNKTPAGDVLKILRLSASLMVHVLTKWQESLPLAKRMRKASEEQPRISSRGAQ
ncbi:MAG: hypothetical protein PHH57_09050 [Candidatus Omnitrophica bacterium]|nr:hypothetical protein [Candidatus Omnitrophota bacterium]